jgi:hypothetical protein
MQGVSDTNASAGGKTEIKEVEKEDFELLEANQETGEIKENSINNEPTEDEKEYNPFE